MSDHSAALDESAMETSGAEESGTHVDVNEISNLDSHENEEDVSNNEDDYGDPGEEHEFEIIDQIESEEDDRDSGEKAEDDRQRKERENDDDYSTTSDELDDSELHAMLEKGIDKDSIKKLDGYEDGRPTIKHKIVLHELESDPFDILPEGWVCVTHNCGMPVYLHKETRVCTMARPYSLGAASARTHDIPVSAIPCLQYRRQMDKLKVEKGESTMQSNVNVREEASGSTEPSELVTSNSNPLATIKRKIESLKNKRGDKRHSSTIHNYCTKLFQFKTLEVKKYRSWRERRKHLGERNRRSPSGLKENVLLLFQPPSTKLITCPIPGNPKADGNGDNVKKREFILNPTGKSYLCILHEYMQRTLKIQPLYVFKELENSKTPYGATVMINNIEYGTGYASSKKVAKQEAAKETLKVLIPDLFKKITDQEIKRNISDLSFFDDVKVTDPRVNELGNKVGQPSPFQLLLECLRRNFGMGNTQCEVSTKPLKNQKCEFTINVGKHSATVVAKNKREGKQLAAQAILAKLHPHVPSWGSLLRLYGTSVEKPIQKPEEMNDVKSHVPNHSVLESLRQEMRKLHRQKEAIQSKGKIIISSKDLPCKMSGVDL
ncbi:unnamed protein product [Lymnaea stagnalis]|uniref:DRBM domain-containing protein n=1 Tax=Lymnaea stagnalis TaxID=6523 RepID=A0AAV2IGZ0_LYMST